jgi:hypothetical protein
LGGLANGGSARHNVRTALAAQPVLLPDCLLPRSGIQGCAYPSKESVLLSIGQIPDLTGAAAFLLKNRRVPLTLRVEDHGKLTHAVLRLTEVEKISPAVVFWTAKQIEMQYRSAGSGGLILWESLFDTDRDWWLNVLQMEPFKQGATLPQPMMEYLIFLI